MRAQCTISPWYIILIAITTTNMIRIIIFIRIFYITTIIFSISIIINMDNVSFNTILIVINTTIVGFINSNFITIVITIFYATINILTVIIFMCVNINININISWVKFSRGNFLLQLTDFILRGMDKGYHTGMRLADLQNTFATSPHTVIPQKWKVLVLRSQSLNDSKLYLSNSNVFVTLEHIAPQRFFLGHNFDIYKWFKKSLNKAGPYPYADNTYILYQDIDVIKSRKIFKWFIEKKLSIYFGGDKTKKNIFSRKKRLSKVEHIVPK